jgi:hypothetical protein
MTRINATLRAALVTLTLAGCADGGLVQPTADAPDSPDIMTEIPVTGLDADAEVLEEVQNLDDATDAETLDVPIPATCPGGFQCPCELNSQCFSDFCAPGPKGLECSKPCENECPSGYSCRPVSTVKGDPTFICVYDHVFFCWPCNSNTDCAPALVEGSPHRCLPGPDPTSGSFCATACGQTADCPPGAACVGNEGGAGGNCQPQFGECACSQPARLCCRGSHRVQREDTARRDL